MPEVTTCRKCGDDAGGPVATGPDGLCDGCRDQREPPMSWAVSKTDPKVDRLIKRVGKHAFLDADGWWLMPLAQARVAGRCGCKLHQWVEEFGGGEFVRAQLPEQTQRQISHDVLYGGSCQGPAYAGDWKRFRAGRI